MTSVTSFVFLLVSLLCSALPGFAQTHAGNLTGIGGPTFLAIDTRAGTTWLYVAEHGEIDGTGGGRILRYNLTSGSTTPQEVALRGTADGQFISPDGILVDAATGDLFIADRFLNRVQRLSVDPTTGESDFVMKWGQDVVGAADEMTGPMGLARDSAGAIYVTEHGEAASGARGKVVSKYTISGNTATRVWRFSNGVSTPYGIAVSGSSVLVADGYNSRVQTWSLDGTPQGSFPVGAGQIVLGLSLDTTGALWVVESSGNGRDGTEQQFERRTVAGALAGVQFGSHGVANGQFRLPFHAVLNNTTNRLYVSDYYNNRVQIFDMTPPASDTTPPTVAVTANSGAATATSVTFNVNFSEAVSGVTPSVFTATGSGGLTVAGTPTVTPGTGANYVVTVNFTGTSGSVALALNASAQTSIRDAANNAYAGGASSGGSVTATHTVTPAPVGDTAAPSIIGFALDTDTVTSSGATVVVTFSEPVTGVDAADFATNTTGTATATVASVTPGASAAVYNVAFTYGGTSGSFQMGIRTSGTGIEDLAGNDYVGAGLAATIAYPVNNAAPLDMDLPAVATFTAGTPAGSSVNFALTFNEAVTGVGTADFQVVATGTAAGTVGPVVQNTSSSYTVPVSFTGSGTIQLVATGGVTSNIRDNTTHWFAGGSSAASATVTVGGGAGPAPTIAATQAATSGTVGSAYSYQVVATGATSFSTTSTLPAGLSLSTTGAISGTPTAATPAGGTTIAVTATNANGSATGNVVITIVAAGSAPTIAASQTATSGTVGTPYNYQVVATGATGFSTTSTLPAGLSLSATGVISGTPTVAGTTTIAVRASNANGNATGNVVLTIAAAGSAPTIAATQTATSGTVGTPYNYQVVATGATGFSTTSTLPAGLSLSATGVISGTPTTAGSSTIAVRVTNANGNATGNVVIAIVAAPTGVPVVSNASVSGRVGSSISPVTVSATNSPTAFSASGLATYGLSISNSGVISGTPTATASNATVSVTATNGAGTSTAATITLNIQPAIVIPPPPPPPVRQNQTITFVGPVSEIFVNKPFQLGATATSSLPISYAVVSGNASVSGDTITIRDTQDVRVRASQAGNANWNAASSVEVTLRAVKSSQSIDFPSMSNQLTTSGSIDLGATASSGLPITYVLVSGPATLNGSTLTLSGEPGTVMVRAIQGGDDAYNPAVEVTRSFAVNPAVRVSNLSSRLRVTPGDGSRAVIAGFVIDGTATTSVLVRAVGPGLAQFGITDGLAAPRLQLFNSAGVVVAENNGWNSSDDVTNTGNRVGAFPLAAGSADSAVVAHLPAGAYTAQVTSAGTGTVLIEVYDAATGAQLSTQQLVNISTRGFVDTGDGALIAGFVVSGSSPKRVLVRGVGPGLTQFNVPSVLADPVVKVYRNGTAAPIAENDNWETAADISAAVAAAGAFPLDAGSKDASIVLELPPGQYSAVISGAGNTTGAGLVEVYELP